MSVGIKFSGKEMEGSNGSEGRVLVVIGILVGWLMVSGLVFEGIEFLVVYVILEFFWVYYGCEYEYGMRVFLLENW